MLQKFDLLRDLSALGSVLRIGGRQDQFRRALARLVSIWAYNEGVPPPPEDRAHRLRDKLILNELLLDRSQPKEFSPPLQSTSSELLRQRGQMIYDMLPAFTFLGFAMFATSTR